MFETINKFRLSNKEKEANNKQWYKDHIDFIDGRSFASNFYLGNRAETVYERKRINYDLFNNILNLQDFEYVCKPFGNQVGELPANFVNRDIVSGKLKVLLGMEMKMPFSWKVVAVNEEATTRKEEEEFSRIKDFVRNQILAPIRADIEKQIMAEQKGKDLTEDEKLKIEQQIQQELTNQTPDEVKKYMLREHQDPAEVLAHQLLEYLIQKERVREKFNIGFQHGLISGDEIFWAGILNGEPTLKVINPLRFDFDRSSDKMFIEDGDYAVCEYRLTPSEIVQHFGDSLTDEQLDTIYNKATNLHGLTNFATWEVFDINNNNTIRCLHSVWKALRKVGFLKYIDEKGQEQLKLVDETYKVRKDLGDVEIEWQWIPEVYEGWKIGGDIYPDKYLRPVPGQFKDLDNLQYCKLPYIGAAYDNLNSESTSAMDRVKHLQYMYNIVMYRLELLLASDKGKILMMNVNMIPRTAGMDLQKWLYYIESTKIGFYNPNEEGNKNTNGNVGEVAKEIDMSLASDINKYIQILEYLDKKAGEAIGVNKQMEGAIGPNDAVSNTRQAITQSSHIIQPFFELHNIVKGNVLRILLETAKVAYAGSNKKKLQYILDDLSLQMLDLDTELLDNSTYGLFITNSSKAFEAKQAIENLAHAAMQTQQADLSDIIKVIRSESIQEAEELLELSSQKKSEQSQAIEKEKMKHQKEMLEMQEASKDKDLEREIKKIKVKAEEDRKTRITEQTILSLGFNEDKDMDEDGVPDVLEIAKHGLNAEIQRNQQQLEREKFEYQKQADKQKNNLEEKKIAISKIKKDVKK